MKFLLLVSYRKQSLLFLYKTDKSSKLMKCYPNKNGYVSPCCNIHPLVAEKVGKMNIPFFYLAAKNSNMYMAVQISKLIGFFCLYDSIMGSVIKKVCV